MAKHVKGSAVTNATSYKLYEYISGSYTEIDTQSTGGAIDFDLSKLTFAAGTHELAVKAFDSTGKYADSNYSNLVSYVYTAPITYYTITYKYMSGSTEIKTATTEQVAAGTTKTFSTSNAPAISGYTVSSVSPTSATITGNITVTYNYAANSGDATTVSFANDDFEVGAYAANGSAVALESRFRTKTTKKFNQNVTFSSTTLTGETNPTQLRFLTYKDNGAVDTMSDWITTSYTVPANTTFHLILAKSSGGNVLATAKDVVVPEKATRLYVGTLKDFKDKSYVVANGQTIQGTEFVNGVYYYGSVGSTVGRLTSSSKAAGYNGFITVTSGATVSLKLFASGTVPYVFTDDNDIIIATGPSADFPAGEFDPLDFFTYSV